MYVCIYVCMYVCTYIDVTATAPVRKRRLPADSRSESAEPSAVPSAPPARTDIGEGSRVGGSASIRGSPK